MSSPTRVLLLLPSLRGGGAERFFTILLQHLDRKRFEPHLGVFHAMGEYLQQIPKDVVVHDFKCGRARYALPHIVRLVRKLRPRAVLSTLPQCNTALMAMKPLLPRNTKLILSEAALPSMMFKDEALGQTVWTWLYRLLYRRADKVVCLSRSMADEMLTDFRIPAESVSCIYYPVDFERVRELGETGLNPYNGPGPQLVAAGRLCSHKGFDVLLAAMPKVSEAFPEVQLAILGQGELQGELKQQARTLGLNKAVSFCGFQANPWRFMRHADLFVLSSRTEGLGYVLLEAMALGKPIVATDCPGGIRELKSYIPSMTLVPAEDPEALAQAIIAACATLPNRAANVISRPSDAALAAFGVQNIVEQYSELLLG